MNINATESANVIVPVNRIDAGAVSTARNQFETYIQNSFEQVNQALLNGDNAIEQLHTGEAASLHEVMIAVEEAELSLRMFVQIKNKAMQAYEEIMRMQV